MGRWPAEVRCIDCDKLLSSKKSKDRHRCAPCERAHVLKLNLLQPQGQGGACDSRTHPPLPDPPFFPICGYAWVAHARKHFCKLRAGHSCDHNARCPRCTVSYGPYGMKTRRVPDPVPQARGTPPTQG